MRSLILLTALALFPLTSVPARQGRDGVQFAVAVDLVVFSVTVTDNAGRPVPGLTTADFHVDEERRAQAITFFRAEDAPAIVGLVIDNSGSMRDKRTEVAVAALAFVTASHPDDELFVEHFNERVFFGLPPDVRFTKDRDQIRAALARLKADGMTALYDAVAAGLDHVKAGTRERAALVVLSDGGDNASRRRLDDVLVMAEQSRATIYTIGLYDEVDRDRNPGVLRKIAAASGGRAYFPATLGDLEPVWRDIAAGIRSQYTIGYYPSHPGQTGAFRRVTITVRREGGPKLRVTTRPGYRPAGPSVAK